jgi:hypothetical protein
MASGAQSAPDIVADSGLGARPLPIPPIIDFAGWGAARGDAHFQQLSGLETAAATLDPSTPPGASAALDLARFHLGHDHGHEALGVLKLCFA